MVLKVLEVHTAITTALLMVMDTVMDTVMAMVMDTVMAMDITKRMNHLSHHF
jgi:hypothetical protein